MKMKYLEFIKQLEVDHAEYLLSDSSGSDVLLSVDYRHNTYTIDKRANLSNKEFILEMRKFARGLLSRKHGVNLALKEQYV